MSGPKNVLSSMVRYPVFSYLARSTATFCLRSILEASVAEVGAQTSPRPQLRQLLQARPSAPRPYFAPRFTFLTPTVPPPPLGAGGRGAPGLRGGQLLLNFLPLFFFSFFFSFPWGAVRKWFEAPTLTGMTISPAQLAQNPHLGRNFPVTPN